MSIKNGGITTKPIAPFEGHVGEGVVRTHQVQQHPAAHQGIGQVAEAEPVCGDQQRTVHDEDGRDLGPPDGPLVGAMPDQRATAATAAASKGTNVWRICMGDLGKAFPLWCQKDPALPVA